MDRDTIDIGLISIAIVLIIMGLLVELPLKTVLEGVFISIAGGFIVLLITKIAFHIRFNA